MKKNSKKRVVKVSGKLFTVYTIGELADKLERSVETIRKMEERQVLPTPNLRGNPTKDGAVGIRLYTEELVNKLVEEFKTVKQGVKISDKTIQNIAIAFKEEKTKLTTI